MFTSLLSSLLFAFLVLAVATLPVDSAETELQQLTISNFSTSTKHGVWFIEFFSPWCGHCRTFAPIWKQLVEHVESQGNLGINLAQVNCVAQGDLCSEKKVRGYPSLKLYEDGKEMEEFNDDRDFDVLKNYVAKHARISGSRSPPNPEGVVLPLDKNLFKNTITQGPTFVKFFVPWCGHCKKLAPTWVKFAAQMMNKVTIAEVNCETYSDLCSQEGVQGYPMVFFYQHGHKVEFTGRRTLEALETFADAALAPPLKAMSLSELSPVLQKEDVIYLLVHNDLKADLRDRIEEAAKPLHGSPRVFSVQSSPQLLLSLSFPDTQNLPVFVALKDHSMTPFNRLVVEPDARISEMSDWLIAHSLPISTELHAENFQRIMGSSPPTPGSPSRLVVLAAVSSENQAHIDVVKEVGTAWNRGPHADEEMLVVFAWIDREKWASWLKSVYSIKKGSEPAVVIVDHGRLLYYDSSVAGKPIRLEVSSILSALDDVSSGIIQPKHSENIAERFARRLNGWVLSMKSGISRHPMRTILFVVVMLVGMFIAAKRLLEQDERKTSVYANHKSGSRLD